MKPIVKKITIIALTLAVVVGCLCVPASAFVLDGGFDAPDKIALEESILSPSFVSVTRNDLTDYGDQSVVGGLFTISPFFPLIYETNNGNPARVRTYYNDTVGDNIISEGFTHAQLAQFADLFRYETSYLYKGSTSATPFQYQGYASKLPDSSSESDDHQQLYLRFPSFTYDPDADSSARWELSFPNAEMLYGDSPSTPQIYVTTTYYAADANTGKPVLESASRIYNLLSLDYQDYYTYLYLDDLIVISEGSTPLKDSEGRSIIYEVEVIVRASSRGRFVIDANDASRSVARPAPSTAIIDATTSYDDFDLLGWLSTSADAFLNTPMFNVGGLEVTLAGLLGMFIGILAFIAFLRRYAGG